MRIAVIGDTQRDCEAFLKSSPLLILEESKSIYHYMQIYGGATFDLILFTTTARNNRYYEKILDNLFVAGGRPYRDAIERIERVAGG